MNIEKLKSLRLHILQSGLGLPPDAVHMSIESGTVQSPVGQSNQHFALTYQVFLLFQDTQKPLNDLVYVVLGWLDYHQPHRPEEAFTFQVQPLNEQSSDIAFTLTITENVRAVKEASGTRLETFAIPNITETGIAVTSVTGHGKRS